MSVDNQVDEEWTTAADGPHKRQRASDLAARLKSVWAPQGLIQRGQGRWYPGEPLPRWQIALYWRTDGRPLWTDDALLADPWSAPSRRLDGGQRRRPTRCSPGSPTGLGLPPSQVRPAYEDPLSRLAAKVRKPKGDPVEAGRRPRPDRPTPPRTAPRCWRASTNPPRPRPRSCCRCTAATTSSAGPARTGGCAAAASCCSRAIRPAGLRLPLDSISWRAAARVVRRRPPHRRRRAAGGARHRATRWSTDSETAPPTAMVAEVRDGLLYIFVPPTEALEHFVDLIARVEAAAAKADCPVVIEGYGPPPDPRLQSMTITPDPGVIEVNVRAHRQFRRTNAAAGNPVRAGPAGPIVHGVVRRRRHARRHRRRQPHHARRRHARGLAAAAPPGSAGLAADLLAAAPVAVLPVRRAIRRHHVAGAAGRRGPRRGALRTRDRVRRDRPAGGGVGAPQAVGDRPRAAAPAHRHHRQHPSRRVLHRQALQPRQPPRQARPAGAARLRDAAASAHGDGAVAAGALAGGVVLGRTAARPADPARRQPARAIPVAALLDSRHRRRGRRPACARHRIRDQLAGPVHRVPLPAHRHRRLRRRGDRAARGDRTVEHPRRGVHRRPAPPATSTRRSSASRSASSAPTATATW